MADNLLRGAAHEETLETGLAAGRKDNQVRADAVGNRQNLGRSVADPHQSAIIQPGRYLLRGEPVELNDGAAFARTEFGVKERHLGGSDRLGHDDVCQHDARAEFFRERDRPIQRLPGGTGKIERNKDARESQGCLCRTKDLNRLSRARRSPRGFRRHRLRHASEDVPRPLRRNH